MSAKKFLIFPFKKATIPLIKQQCKEECGMKNEKGSVSIHSENILPIIKKWLYSDKDIFVREMIANGCDAITKHKKLSAIGEAQPSAQPYAIHVTIDPKQKTLSFADNGIGMTEEEVKKYINQVAFSGAKDFLAQYEQAGDDAIIGHFGLGFYSAFMVSKKVQIDTLSWQEGAEAVLWESEDGSEYQMSPGSRTERGTTITLFINEEDSEYMSESQVRSVIEKYCAFLPVEIYLEDLSKKKEEQQETSSAEEQKEAQDPAVPEPLNDIAPLWLKNPSECTEEEYKDFYHKALGRYDDPLFYIHLNVDYPFNLKGILYFPQLSKEFNGIEGQIKLYNNQVFVADNIPEVIPEFLMLLRGVIDCPDLPLNVSRSFLQNDGTVKKMQAHITKKVADKLKALFNTQRETYDKYWKDINPFIKFGVIKDDKFYEQMKDALLFEKLDGSMWTLSELQDYAKENGGKVYYVSDRQAQAFYVDLFEQQGQQAILLDGAIDNHFISFIEYKCQGLTFGRIDSEVAQTIKGEYVDMPESKPLEELMKKVSGKEGLVIEVAPLKSAELPAMLIMDESMRRFAEMSTRMGGQLPFEPESKLVLNGSSSLVRKLAGAQGDKAELIAGYIYDLALLGKGMLSAEQTKEFMRRSAKILELVEL
jgi:molecular chaperone HtpG